jgi:CheY-like chemotaxis protein
VAARLTPVESRGVANPFHNGGALLGGPTQGLTSVSTVGCRWDIPRMNDSHRYLDANADLAGVRVPAQLALYRSAYPSLKASSVNYQLADPPITGVWRRPASAEGRAHERPDLTIGGIVMPTTDGYEIARELRDACCRRWKSYARVLASRQSSHVKHILPKPGVNRTQAAARYRYCQGATDVVSAQLGQRASTPTVAAPSDEGVQHMHLLTSEDCRWPTVSRYA